MKINQVYDISGSDIHSFEDYATINLRLNHSCQDKESWVASRIFLCDWGKEKYNCEG
jgi:hypothetical protein